eukprot:3951423-Pyramimonas_sp.AAC.1
MGVQLISSYRLQAARVSHLVRLHDATNAFFSLKHERFLKLLPTLYADQDLQAARDRVLRGFFLFEDESGSFWLRPHGETFPGYVGATSMFARTLSPPVQIAIADLCVSEKWFHAVKVEHP